MPLADVSQVTESLRRLLQNAITPQPSVSTSPPESIEGTVNEINVYLYHVSEDPHNRINPRQSTGRAIATSPLALELHYIVTAHTLPSTEFSTLTEQNLLGQAMKVFHDFPVLDDNTVAGNQRVFPQDIQGQDNRFEINLVQMSPQESLNFWGNEENFTAKPSAYYLLRSVHLIPNQPTRVPGVVLSLGTFITNMDTVAIGATQSELHYTLPTEMGGGPASLTTSPAKVGPISPGPNQTNLLRLKGTSLTKGEIQTLLLNHPHWTLLYSDMPHIPVDMSANAPLGWSLNLTEDGAEITVGEDMQFDRPDGSTETVALYPGTYVATWQISELFNRSDGTQQIIDQRSNSATFTINPRISGFARNGVTGDVTLNFGGSWLLNRGRAAVSDPREEPQLDILLSVDGDAYALDDGPSPTTEATFTIADHALTYSPSASANNAGTHAVSVVINGAETQPFWIEI